MKNNLLMKLLPVIIGLIVVNGILQGLDILVPPLMFFVSGLFLIGIALPELFAKKFEKARSLWMPVSITIIGLIAFYAVFTTNTLNMVLSNAWCGWTPCLPLGVALFSLALGNVANLAARQLAGENVDWLGEN